LKIVGADSLRTSTISRSVRSVRPPQRCGDRSFDGLSSNSMQMVAASWPRLHRRYRCVVAVPYTLLDGVGRRHQLARAVEQFPQQQRMEFGAIRHPLASLRSKLRLGALEEIAIEDRLMLPFVGLILVVDLADIVTVTQDV
jgi:hypothetical protein